MERFAAALVALLITGPAGAAPPATVDGAALFKKNCASCHGADGKGGSGPSIAGKPAGFVAGVLDAHPPPMNQIELTPDEMAAAASYVSSLKK